MCQVSPSEISTDFSLVSGNTNGINSTSTPVPSPTTSRALTVSTAIVSPTAGTNDGAETSGVNGLPAPNTLGWMILLAGLGLLLH
jgi:hypothetical protein